MRCLLYSHIRSTFFSDTLRAALQTYTHTHTHTHPTRTYHGDAASVISNTRCIHSSRSYGELLSLYVHAHARVLCAATAPFLQTCMYTHTHTHARTAHCTLVDERQMTHIHLHPTHARTYTHVHKQTHTHAHTHTHTGSRVRLKKLRHCMCVSSFCCLLKFVVCFWMYSHCVCVCMCMYVRTCVFSCVCVNVCVMSQSLKNVMRKAVPAMREKIIALRKTHGEKSLGNVTVNMVYTHTHTCTHVYRHTHTHMRTYVC